MRNTVEVAPARVGVSVVVCAPRLGERVAAWTWALVVAVAIRCGESVLAVEPCVVIGSRCRVRALVAAEVLTRIRALTALLVVVVVAAWWRAAMVIPRLAQRRHPKARFVAR